MFPVADFSVADDFAAIAKRLKEIQAEAAKEPPPPSYAAAQPNNERRPESCKM